MNIYLHSNQINKFVLIADKRTDGRKDRRNRDIRYLNLCLKTENNSKYLFMFSKWDNSIFIYALKLFFFFFFFFFSFTCSHPIIFCQQPFSPQFSHNWISYISLILALFILFSITSNNFSSLLLFLLHTFLLLFLLPLFLSSLKYVQAIIVYSFSFFSLLKLLFTFYTLISYFVFIRFTYSP